MIRILNLLKEIPHILKELYALCREDEYCQSVMEELEGGNPNEVYSFLENPSCEYIFTHAPKTLWDFGNALFQYYGDQCQFHQHSYERVHHFSIYGDAEPLERVLVALFNLAYISAQNLLQCLGDCPEKGKYNYITAHAQRELACVQDTTFYEYNKIYLDQQRRYIEKAQCHAKAFQKLIAAFVKMFMAAYPKTGFYLDERCVDVTSTIDALHYVRRVYVNPQEFFVWAQGQGLPLPDDVVLWLKKQCSMTCALPAPQEIPQNNSQDEPSNTPQNPPTTSPLISPPSFSNNADQQKQHALLLARGELSLVPEKSTDWVILRVGILGLEGLGHKSIVTNYEHELGVHSTNWARDKRNKFISFMLAKHELDTAPFFPKASKLN